MDTGCGWFGLEGWVRFSVRVGFSDTRVDFLVDTGLVRLVWFGSLVWFTRSMVVVVVDVEQTNHSCKVSCKGSENGEQKKKKKQPMEMEMEMESNRGINLLLKQNHLFDYSFSKFT